MGASAEPSRAGRQADQRGEVFPVAILFGGVLLTILIGVHVVLVSLADTAAQSAADRAVTAVQGIPPVGPTCGILTTPIGSIEPESERECVGVLTAWSAMNASVSMVALSRPPEIVVDEDAGVVAVYAFGQIATPVLGIVEVVGFACGALDVVEGAQPTRADTARC